MNPIDEKILWLIKLLILEEKAGSIKNFCEKVKMYDTTISRIKKGKAHFTTSQLELICKKFDVNGNWIFGIDNRVFNHKNSIEKPF